MRLSGGAAVMLAIAFAAPPGLTAEPRAIGIMAAQRTIATPTTTAEVAVFTVNNPGGGSDWQLGDGRCDADLEAAGDQCTLLAAVENSRLQSGHSRINFSIGFGPVTIDTGAVSLPMQGRGRSEPGDSLIVDGTTQPGYEGKPLIRIREPATQVGAFPMFVLGPGSFLKGIITDEVSTTPNGGVVIEGNWIGLDSTGDAASDYAQWHPFGVWLGGPGNTLGGTTAAARNVIAGQQRGVQVAGAGTIKGNLIGTDADGTSAVGFPQTTGLSTQGFGVVVASGNGPLIGDNVVAGAAQSGIRIERLASATRVQGNFIGTDINGQSALPNVTGIEIRGATDTIVGGPGAARNLISGNTDGWGISINAMFVSPTWVVADRTTIENNRIGTDLGGSYAIPNAIGVGVRSGSVVVADNLISGNSFIGVQLDRCEPSCGFPQTTGVREVRANRIGTNADGTAALGGSTLGAVRIASREKLNHVTDNLISGNDGHAVIVDFDATQNLIARNTIGLNAAEAAPLPNAGAIDPSMISNGFTPAAVLLRAARETRVEGNVVSGNAADGIHISDALAFGFQPTQAKANVIRGNTIGLNAAGTVAVANEGDGIQIAGDAIENVIGGMSAAPQAGACTGPCNFVSGNAESGIEISGAKATANRIEGNFVGLDETGDSGVGNTVGISIQDGSANSIGGAAPGVGNVISGNEQDGISITGASAAENVVQANQIGLSAGGLAEVGNGRDGIHVETPRNRIGGTTEESGNVVSGNGRHGMLLFGTHATENVLVANLVGTNPTGTEDRGNVGDGIALEGAARNTIGSIAPEDFNTVSGNEGNGIRLAGSAATENTILGNRIGTRPSGAAALGNAGDGILLNASPRNTIGGPVPGAGNLVSGNNGNGIRAVGPEAAETLVQGNVVGATAGGTAALANGGDGILLDRAPQTTVGGADVGAGNLISGNAKNGVAISGAEATGTSVAGNRIGTNRDGMGAVPNGEAGLAITDAPSTSVGGTTEAQRNYISGNGSEGVRISGTATQTTLLGNVVGLTVGELILGSLVSRPLPNGGDGVKVLNATETTIGGEVMGAGNVVSGNGQHGIENVAGTGMRLLGNAIGTDEARQSAIGNAKSGVLVASVAGTVIGAGAAGSPPIECAAACNLISGNGESGVSLGAATASRVVGNYIGTDKTGKPGVESLANQDGIAIANGGENLVDANLVSGNLFSGIDIRGADSSANKLRGNFIGTDITGAEDFGNGAGITIDGAPRNVVGEPDAGNVISGNNGDGLKISGAGATETLVQANKIGTYVDASGPIENIGDGIEIDRASQTLVGGSEERFRNVISGNRENGVLIKGAGASQNRLEGNLIGPFVSPPEDEEYVSNREDGVLIRDASQNVVGGTVLGSRNVVSGNTRNGIEIAGRDSSSNRIQGNVVGLEPSGDDVLRNGTNGILIVDASSTLVGGNVPLARNVVSGNGGAGIVVNGSLAEVFGVHASDTVIQGNFVGTDLAGMDELGNLQSGVKLLGLARRTIIGGTEAGAGNLISGNGAGFSPDGQPPDLPPGYGPSIDGSGIFIGIDEPTATTKPSDTSIAGNLIGTTASGAAPLANTGDGITVEGATETTIGGTEAGARNIASGNGQNGIRVKRSATGTSILGNYVGLYAGDPAGIPGNTARGIAITGAPNVVVGGEQAGARNVISGNGAEGVSANGADGPRLLGNYIGTSVDGTQARANRGEGVSLTDSPNATIGGMGPDGRNVVSGNGVAGAPYTGSGILVVRGNGSRIEGNFVGTNAAGLQALPNAGVGVLVPSQGVHVGGTGRLDDACGVSCNLISGNRGGGLLLVPDGIGGSGNHVVQGNRIGTDAEGRPGLGNEGVGILVTGPNSLLGGTVLAVRNIVTGNQSGIEAGGSGYGGSPVSNRILGNSIYDNAKLGIDLAANGVTPNDPGDADEGPNALQNSPFLSSAKTDGDLVKLVGTLGGRPSVSYRIEIFASKSCDPSGFGEGEKLVGSFAASADTFSQELPKEPALPFITATATDPQGNTSEFSRCAMVDGGSISGSNPAPVPGGAVTISGDGLAPRSDASVSLFSEPVVLGTVHADDAGNFSGTFPIPVDTELGPHRIEVSGIAPDSSARTLVFDIWVSSSNRQPLADAGTGVAAKEGELVMLDGSGSSDPDGDPLDYTWTQLEGTAVTLSDTSVAKPTFTVPDEGTYRFALEVRDGTLTSVQDEVVVTATNAAPTATFIAPTAVLEGSTFALTLASAVDAPADLAELQLAFDCGAGYGTFGVAAAATCPASDNGTRSVGGRVRDGDGGEREYRATVTVENVVPSITAAPAQTATAGQETAFELGSFADPGPDAPWTVRVDWGDGAQPTLLGPAVTPGPLGTASHTYPAAGTFTATVSVVDKDGDTGSAAFRVTVGTGREPAQQQCIVPRLRGKTLAQAKVALARSRCKLGHVRKAKSKKAKKGRVVGQAPAAGRRLPVGSKVNLVLSEGPPKKTKKKSKRR